MLSPNTMLPTGSPPGVPIWQTIGLLIQATSILISATVALRLVRLRFPSGVSSWRCPSFQPCTVTIQNNWGGLRESRTPLSVEMNGFPVFDINTKIPFSGGTKHHCRGGQAEGHSSIPISLRGFSPATTQTALPLLPGQNTPNCNGI